MDKIEYRSFIDSDASEVRLTFSRAGALDLIQCLTDALEKKYETAVYHRFDSEHLLVINVDHSEGK